MTATKGDTMGIDCLKPFQSTEYVKGERKEVTRHRIDARAFWREVRHYIGGHWVETRVSEYEEDRYRWLSVESRDGVRLWIGAQSDYGRGETKVSVSCDRYQTPEGEDIDLKWTFRDASDTYPAPDRTPRAVVDVTKRDAKAIAADIKRRVVDPITETLPKIRERQAESAKRMAGLASALATLGAIPGARIHHDTREKGYRSKAATAEIGSLRFTISGAGVVEVEKFGVRAEEVAALVACVAKLDKAST